MSDENIQPRAGARPRDDRKPTETPGVRNIKATSGAGLACPRCGGPVGVGTNPVLMQFGLIGLILHQMTKSYSCPACGKLKFNEFPEEVRRKQRTNALLMALGFLLLVALGVGVAIWLSTR